MTDDEKRQLAEILVPHLAWDLSRADLFRFEFSDTTTGAAVEILIQQIIHKMRSKAHRGEPFTVAIIPVKPAWEST